MFYRLGSRSFIRSYTSSKLGKKIVTKIEANPLLQKRGGENGILRVAAYCRVSTEANPLLQKRGGENGILRVAAYCRVSTDSEDQLESYNAQVSHYTETIMKNPKWQFVKIYADEGITGTLARKREEFLKMIRDCEKG